MRVHDFFAYGKTNPGALRVPGYPPLEDTGQQLVWDALASVRHRNGDIAIRRMRGDSDLAVPRVPRGIRKQIPEKLGAFPDVADNLWEAVLNTPDEPVVPLAQRRLAQTGDLFNQPGNINRTAGIRVLLPAHHVEDAARHICEAFCLAAYHGEVGGGLFIHTGLAERLHGKLRVNAHNGQRRPHLMADRRHQVPAQSA